jgi:hypothetical protein
LAALFKVEVAAKNSVTPCSAFKLTGESDLGVWTTKAVAELRRQSARTVLENFMIAITEKSEVARIVSIKSGLKMRSTSVASGFMQYVRISIAKNQTSP